MAPAFNYPPWTIVCQDGGVTRAQTWGGRTADERRTDRRERLMAAATEIWADGGWASVTMRGVCAKAGLIDRYFYESFADRDELLVAVWDRARDRVTSSMLQSVAAQAGAPPLDALRSAVRGVLDGFVQEPSRAQILFGDHSGSPNLEHRRHRLLIDVADVMVEIGMQYLKSDVDRSEFRQSVLMGVGGFLELVAAWRAGVIEGSADDIVEQVSHFGAILGKYYLPDEDISS